jgi:hypothetical protein
MPTINQLNAVDNPNGSDLLPIYSQQNGDARKLSLTNLLTWLTSAANMGLDNRVTQYAVPLPGDTVLVTDEKKNVWLIITPTGTLATLTIKMPLMPNTVDRQELLVNSTQAVTALSFDSNGSTLIGAPTSLAANAFFRLRYDAVSKVWYRVG